MQYGQLYRKVNQGKQSHLALCLPRERVAKTLRSYHDGDTGSHSGIQKTYDTLRRVYYWPNMYQDIANYVRSCKACQLIKVDSQAQSGLYQPLEVPQEAWSHLVIDTVGPINPPTEEGHRHILTLSDRLTKWAYAVPLLDITSESVSAALEDYFLKYVIPKTILSDRGTSFTSATTEELFRRHNIRHITSSGYNPQTQGQIEVFNRTLINGLAAQGYQGRDEANTKWHLALPGVVYGYNCGVHAASGQPPIELAFGVAPNRPIDNELAAPDMRRHDLSRGQQLNLLRQQRRSARDDIIRSQLRNKRRVDPHRRDVHYQTGDKVLIYKPARKQQLGGKLRPRYTGPAHIVARTGKVNYLVSSRTHPRPKLTHVRRLKPYHSRPGVYTDITTEGDTDFSTMSESEAADNSSTEEYFDAAAERTILGKRPVRRPVHLKDFTQ